jgi:hypothetical protein
MLESRRCNTFCKGKVSGSPFSSATRLEEGRGERTREKERERRESGARNEKVQNHIVQGATNFESTGVAGNIAAIVQQVFVK